LDIGIKKRVHHRARAYKFEINDMPTSTHLDVLPFFIYNILLGMDWLYLHRNKVDCYENDIECLDDDGDKRTLQGKKKATSGRIVTTMQVKHSCRKGCVLFTTHISSGKGKDVEDVEVLKRYQVLKQFQDVFLVEIS